jgi:hypothetical protein
MKRLLPVLFLAMALTACAPGPRNLPRDLPRIADAACPSGERFVRPHTVLHGNDGVRAHADGHDCAPSK